MHSRNSLSSIIRIDPNGGIICCPKKNLLPVKYFFKLFKDWEVAIFRSVTLHWRRFFRSDYPVKLIKQSKIKLSIKLSLITLKEFVLKNLFCGWKIDFTSLLNCGCKSLILPCVERHEVRVLIGRRTFCLQPFTFHDVASLTTMKVKKDTHNSLIKFTTV